MVKRLIIILSLQLFSIATVAAESFEASVNKKELLLDEHVVLTLKLINSETRLRAEGVSPNIDLTLLTNDFELGIPKATNRYNNFRNQGRSTSTVTVELFPKNHGSFVIPSFTVDDLKTTPITLKVHNVPKDKNPEVFSRSGVINSKLFFVY